ncbi:glycosyltransferase [Shinella oryzae]|uniref:glycosyltransferase n=1 Tax=Shinella oryzae TaxID=2871820 RepID=UPI001FF566CF|nr:glycosyltransferase [Shinella oryzae]UPA25205.1 glycosyltransferase [Shinella oryzae]
MTFKPVNDRSTVVVVTNLARGGAQQIALAFARHLETTNNLIDVLLLDPTRQALNEAKPFRVRGILGTIGHKLLYPVCIFALALRLRHSKPAIVLSTLLVANVVTLLAARLAFGKRILCVIRETTTIGARSRRGGVLGRVLCQLAKWVYPLADAVIAPSEGVAQDIVGNLGLPRGKVHVLLNPTIDEGFHGRSLEKASYRFQHETAGPLYVACGRLGPEKGYDVLLRAFADVHHRVAGARLIIMGEGALLAELQALASILGISAAVDFAGYVSNPLPIIRQSNVFVLASRWEGLPNALIQALGCGTTPVATDCPSGPKEILEDGRYGYLVPVDDVPALSTAMVTAWQSPMPANVLKARSEDFSEQRVFAQYETLIGSLMRGRV